MPEILIENTSAQMHGIGKPQAGAALGALVAPPLVNLKPGLNKVDAADWALAKQQKMVQVHIDEGTFKELKEVDSLTRLSPTESNKYIQLAAEPKLLQEWLGIEKRTAVKKMLNDRIAELAAHEPGTVKPDGKGGKRE